MSTTTPSKAWTTGEYIKRGVGVILLIILVLGLLSSCAQVPNGNIGVVTQFGAATGAEFHPGLHFKLPFVQDVATFNTQIQLDQSSSVEAATSDLQTVQTTVAVNFHPDPSQISTIFQRVGTDYKATIIDPAILESVKAVTARYTAAQLVTERAIVKQNIDDVLIQRLAPYNILVDTINITNFHFSDAFNNAIEAKQVAAQAVLTAQQQLDRAKIDAQQQVVTAQAAAQAQIVTAQANAKAQELQQKSLTSLYIQYQALQKWNGVLPQYNSGALPFLTIPSGK